MKHPTLTPWILLALVAMTPGCRDSSQEPSPLRRSVAVTVLPHAWLVEQIAGGHFDVVTVVQPGENAELYQPSDIQVNQIAQAVVYFRTGMPFEESRTLETIRKSGSLHVVDLRQGIELRDMPRHVHEPADADDHADHDHADHDHDEHGSHGGEGKDPHIWLSPRLLKIQAKTVAETLQKIDPEHRDDYGRNLIALEKRLDELDQAVQAKLAPHQGKAFFVVHPAWGYFAADYGLREIAVEIEGKEPSDRELTELQVRAQEEDAKVIFVQPQSPRRAAEGIAKAIGARVEELDDLSSQLDVALRDTSEKLAGALK